MIEEGPGRHILLSIQDRGPRLWLFFPLVGASTQSRWEEAHTLSKGPLQWANLTGANILPPISLLFRLFSKMLAFPLFSAAAFDSSASRFFRSSISFCTLPVKGSPVGFMRLQTFSGYLSTCPSPVRNTFVLSHPNTTTSLTE